MLNNIYENLDYNMIDISNSIIETFDALSSLNNAYSSGPDSIPSILLKNCRWSLTKPIHYFFNRSLKSGIFPKAWKVTTSLQSGSLATDLLSPTTGLYLN